MEPVRPLLALALAASLGGPALCAQPQGRSVAAPSRAGSGPTAPLLNGTVVTYTLGTTQSGFPESVLVGIPNGASSSAPTPALILFHGYYEDPADLQVRTSFFDEALARGWFVIAPLGANIANFGIDYAQQNTEDALTYVWALHGSMIDAERVYGVGFSMGGGWASSYAARHVGNSDVRMAAQLIHTGTQDFSSCCASCPFTPTECWPRARPAHQTSTVARAIGILTSGAKVACSWLQRINGLTAAELLCAE